ncbi:MAG: FtsX-like permease family protein [Acidobacteriota bacterium]
MRKLLLAGQVAIAVCVLISAGLLLRSFALLQMVDPGLRAEGLLTFNIDFSERRYPSRERIAAFSEEVLRRVASVPGVDSAGLSSVLPLGGTAIDDPFSIEGRPLDLSRLTLAGHQNVSPDFFRSLEIPLVRGRYFTEADIAGSPAVAIINEQLATRFFANEEAIGRRIKLGAPQAPGAWVTIVGVVKDIPHRRIDSQPQPDWFLPQSQSPTRHISFFVRTGQNPLNLASQVRGVISAVDPQQPVVNVRTMEDAIGQTLAPRRFNTILSGLFGVVALLLAGSGIYSVVSYGMQRRRREIGVRVALGAQRSDVLRLALSEGMIPALIGMTIGLVLSLATARVLKSLLFGLTVYDPLTFVSMVLVLGMLAFLGCYLPARRASGIDPLAALRYE